LLVAARPELAIVNLQGRLVRGGLFAAARTFLSTSCPQHYPTPLFPTFPR
jgi:hypothetical protein